MKRSLSILKKLPFLLLLCFFYSCSVDETLVNPELSGYSDEIAHIIIPNCTGSGCHNKLSKDACAGLSLETWNDMMLGGRNGAVTIPFNHSQSSLFLYSNTFKDLGVSAIPTMPLNAAPLNKEQVIKIQKWIDQGAPNRENKIKFADNPLRKKAYITNQGCDLVTVLDLESGLAMRFIPVGNNPQTESPHQVKVSPDGKLWAVVFTNSNFMQIYSTASDKLLGEINLGPGNWNTLTITKDSKKAFAVNWNANGSIAYVDLEQFKLLSLYQSQSGLFHFPHGVALSPDEKKLYVTAQTGNYLYKIDISDPLSPEEEKISLIPGQEPSNFSSLDPHELIFTPDGEKYAVTCQKSNEVRMYNTKNDSLLSIIKTGKYPQEMSLSKKSPYLFVTCSDDDAFAGKLGSVAVIDYQNNELIKSVYTGFQPHGISVSDYFNKIYVTHRNIDINGPVPHHISSCGGRNGYLTVIDLLNLETTNQGKTELFVDPYSIDVIK